MPSSTYSEEEIRDREEQAANSAPASASSDASVDAVRDSEQGAGQSGKPPSLGARASEIFGVPLTGGVGSSLKTLGKILWGSNRRKAATMSSGGGALIILAFIWVVNFSAGPFAFINLAQILSKNFDPQAHQTEKRMGKLMFEMIFNPPEDVKNPIGDNRLSTLGYLMKNYTLNKLKAKGVKPLLKDNGYSFDGFSIDPNNKDSPYNQKFSEFEADGADEAEALLKLKDFILHDLDPDGVFGLTGGVQDGGIIIRGKQTLLSDTGIKAMSDLLVSGDHPAFDGFWDLMRVRNLSRWTISGNFHWISKLNAKVTSTKDAWLKKFIYDPIKNKFSGNTTDGVAVESKDAKGNPVETPLQGGKGPVSESTVKSFLADPKGFAGVAGGAAAAAGIICILKAINEAVGFIRWTQVDVPMMKIASIPLSIGSQLQSGQDIDPKQLSAVADSMFNSYDKSGNVTSTYYDAASLRATAGDSGGIDMNQALKDMIRSNSVPWLEWTNSAPVNSLCSAPAQIALTGISVALILVPGVDVINAAAGVVIFGGISTLAVNVLPGILAGHGINIKASGAEWGNDIAYGGRMMANQHALQEGGTVLTQQQETQLTAEVNAQDRQQFHNESLADRIFNPADYRSIVGSMIDRTGVYNARDLVAKVGDIPNIIGSLFSLPASIMSASAHAASTYQFPFPAIGFSNADVDNPIVDQPFANADKVSAILDAEQSSGDHTYIDKALNCFGVTITKDYQGWQAIPTTATGTDGQDHTFGPDPYDTTHYSQSDCADSGNTDWLRIRMWILDLSTMEGYACSLGDDVSCANSGF